MIPSFGFSAILQTDRCLQLVAEKTSVSFIWYQSHGGLTGFPSPSPRGIIAPSKLEWIPWLLQPQRWENSDGGGARAAGAYVKRCDEKRLLPLVSNDRERSNFALSYISENLEWASGIDLRRLEQNGKQAINCRCGFTGTYARSNVWFPRGRAIAQQ